MYRWCLILTLSLTFLPPLVAAAAGATEADADVVELRDEQLAGRELATILRAIVGPIQVEFPDEQTLRVRGSVAVLDVCRQVAALIAADSAEGSIDLDDETQVLVVRLERASTSEAMTLLRQSVNPARMGFAADRALVVVRDSPEQIERTRTLLEKLEQPES